jgi:hypothetical protein
MNEKTLIGRPYRLSTALSGLRYAKIVQLEVGLSDNGFKVLAYVSVHEGEATITSITKDSYFRDVSFSTIKRGVLEVLASGLVESRVNALDKRVNNLWLKEEV